MATELTREQQELLLQTARQALQGALRGEKPAPLKLEDYPAPLREKAACFVTLTIAGALRGCVGSIEAAQPLVLEVRERALGAGFQDYRFPPLPRAELDQVRIEISLLTPPRKLEYDSPRDLLEKLQPGVDGVILRFQQRRATFLPQVWEQLPEKELFLSRLCLKLGLDQEAWKNLPLEVEIYRAEKFQEPD